MPNVVEHIRMASQAMDCKTRIKMFRHAARLVAQLPPSSLCM